MAKTDQKQTTRSTGGKRRCRGAIAVLLAIVLPIVVLLAALAINFSYMELVRTQLYVATDTAARAGGRVFAMTGDQDEAKKAARAVAWHNKVAGCGLWLFDDDFTFGQSNRAGMGNRYTFDPAGANPNAVRITGSREERAGERFAKVAVGPVPLLMPSILGINEFEVSMTSESTQVEVDVVLVLDRSGSMAYASNEPAAYPPLPAAAPEDWFFGDPAPNPSRWRDVVAAVDVFLAALTASPSNEHAGLCTYNTNYVIDQAVTDNYASISAALDVYTNQFDAGYTDIGGGIIEGVNALAAGGMARGWATKVIVVLSDGIQTAPNGGTHPLNAARIAADQGVMIFTVTFSDEADRWTMQQVAKIGLGKHFHANDAADLENVFKEIANSLPTLLTE